MKNNYLFCYLIIFLLNYKVCLSQQVSKLTNLPVQACWFWGEDEFLPGGYKTFIDNAALHSPYNLLSVSVRRPGKETISEIVHDQIKKTVEYAAEKGIRIVAVLDVRTARRAFESKYPDELQEMLLLKELETSEVEFVETVVISSDLNDHYTGATTHYIPLYGRLVRVYTYSLEDDMIASESLKDITQNCILISSSKDSIRVKIPPDSNNSKACVLVSYTHLTPDVFAPHLMEFQREIIRKYADIPLAGVFKDEWGFPPCFDGSPGKKQFWYSKYRSQAYSERTGGRDLLADCLMMHRGIKGKEGERIMAINHFMEMSWQRNGALENDYYNAVKEFFGPDAFVTTHPTWWPYPDLREHMKNGLDWWVATRDWAQTDEYTPFAVRTALSKKWGSAVWYNMYYSSDKADYEKAVWSSVLGGGRINYHPIYPGRDKKQDTHLELLRGNLMQAESRVGLLNYISQSPLNCQVAVIFGHACTMNWAGPSYDDVGMHLVNSLWQDGIPADLIPSSEIENKSLVVDEEGWIRYGKQRYSAVVLYHPEFERSTTADFFNKAARGRTSLFKTGNWTMDFNATKYYGDDILPGSMVSVTGTAQVFALIKAELIQRNVSKQTQSVRTTSDKFEHPFISPPATGYCHLIDGTCIQVAGTNNISGDPVRSTIRVNGYPVSFDAIGLAAVRLDENGDVQAIAAGGLKSFRAGNFKITLDKRIDLALWKNDEGEWEGVVQGLDGEIPSQLLLLTQNWTKIKLPVRLDE